MPKYGRVPMLALYGGPGSTLYTSINFFDVSGKSFQTMGINFINYYFGGIIAYTFSAEFVLYVGN